MVHAADIIQHPIDRQYKQTSYVFYIKFVYKVHAMHMNQYSFPSTQFLRMVDWYSCLYYEDDINSQYNVMIKTNFNRCIECRNELMDELIFFICGG